MKHCNLTHRKINAFDFQFDGRTPPTACIFFQPTETRTKALQTVTRFTRETRRRSAAMKSDAFALKRQAKHLDFGMVYR
jgi:hypothetical protein